VEEERFELLSTFMSMIPHKKPVGILRWLPSTPHDKRKSVVSNYEKVMTIIHKMDIDKKPELDEFFRSINSSLLFSLKLDNTLLGLKKDIEKMIKLAPFEWKAFFEKKYSQGGWFLDQRQIDIICLQQPKHYARISLLDL